MFERPRDVLRVIEWLHRVTSVRRVAPLVQEFRVLQLDVRRVEEHGAAEVLGGRGGVDGALEASLDEERDRAGVVDVRVREDERVDRSGLKRERPVPRLRLGPPALKETAIEENGSLAADEEVLRSGHGTRRAPEGDAHAD